MVSKLQKCLILFSTFGPSSTTRSSKQFRGSMILMLFIGLMVSQSQQQTTHFNEDSNFNHSTTTTTTITTKRQIFRPLQRFILEPENQTVNIGESVLLPCKIVNRAGIVQWTRDGFGLGADPKLEGFPTYSMMHNDATGDYSLKISSVTLEDDAIFQCQVGAMDNIPGIRSQNAKLTILVRPDDPVIVMGTMSPDNRTPAQSSNHRPASDHPLQVLTTTAGNKIELTCEAHGGRPAAELTWMNSRNRVVRKGITQTITKMNDGKRFNTALKWSFEPTKQDHNKKLTCRLSHPTITNSSTSPSTSILLEVKYAPEVSLEVSRIIGDGANPLTVFGAATNNLHGRVGDTIKFKCVADGNPGKESLIYEWLKNGEVIHGDHRSELYIDNIDKSFHGSEIVCKVSNIVGTGMASIKLNIAYGPSFLPTMEYVYGVNPGETLRMNCPVDGNPQPEITWIKVGTSHVISTGQKLTIRNVNEESVGEYLCRVSVKGFPEIAAIVYLRINGPPKIRKHKYTQKQYTVLGEPGHLECLVESVPEPIAITWIHNGQIFTSGSKNNIPINIDIHEERSKEEALLIKSSYDIRTTYEHDFGHYNCVVVNSYGSDWHLVSLNEKTSFSTIVIFVSAGIATLVFALLSTAILLLMLKHRKLEQEQAKIRKDSKDHFMNGGSSNMVGPNHISHHNIYSTNSTRTNSSSDKNGPTETGTIITRSGSIGSQRSSTSSFPAYPESSSSPANSRMANHNQMTSPPPPQQQPSLKIIGNPAATSADGGSIDPIAVMFRRSPPPFMMGTRDGGDFHSPLNQSKTDLVAMPPLNSAPYSSLTRQFAGFSPQPPPLMSQVSAASSSSLRNSYSPYVPNYYQQQHSTSNPLGIITPSNDMYSASPYHVVLNNSKLNHNHLNNTNGRLKSAPMPTPTPSLTKELDNCISKNSIATHV